MEQLFTRERTWGHPWALAAAVSLFAMVLRGWVGLRDPILFDDSPRFLLAARNMLEGNYAAALADSYHPLTAGLIAVTSASTGVELEAAGLGVSVLSGGIGALALYALAHSMFGERIALVSALLFAVFPRMVAAATSVQSDGLHLALSLLAAALVWRALEGGRFAVSLGAGTACGLAYLARPEGLAAGVVLMLWLTLDLAIGRVGWRRFARVVVGFLTPALLVAGPYLLSLNSSSAEFTLSHKKTLIPTDPTAITLQQLGAAVWELMRDFRRGWEGLWILLAFGVRWGRCSRSTLYLCSYALLFACLLMAVHLEAGYISRRHWLVPGALLFPFAARGILWLGDFLRQQIRVPALQRWLVPLSVASVIGAFGLREVVRVAEPVKLARKEAALWLSQHEVACLAAERHRVAYYAGAERRVDFPTTSNPVELRDELHSGCADFVITETRILPDFPRGGIPGLPEVHHVEYPGGTVLVLKVEARPDVAAGERPSSTSSRSP